MTNYATLPLPKGIDSFSTIRNDGFLYVDKTHHVLNLIRNERCVFCSRPRRFGKSLLLSTINSIYADDHSLFNGLSIAPHLDEPAFLHRPVIRLDMAISLRSNDPNKLNTALLEKLDTNCRRNHVNLRGDDPNSAFNNLISDLANSYGQAVLLIDEYDYTLHDPTTHPDIQKEAKSILCGFYSQINENNKHLYFTYITGISKFSSVGVFSELSELVDISLHSDYAEMIGFTPHEIEKHFNVRIKHLARPLCMDEDEILDYFAKFYNGFSFDGKAKVYNPHDVFHFLFNERFGNYWMRSGSQEYVKNLLQENGILLWMLDSIPISKEQAADSNELEKYSSAISTLYQTGYLTIRHDSETDNYSLTFPNLEIRFALGMLLITDYYDMIEDLEVARAKTQDSIHSKNYTGIISIFNELISRAYASNKRLLKHCTSDIMTEFYNEQLVSFLNGADFFMLSETKAAFAESEIVAKRNGKTLVMEMEYVDAKPDNDNGGGPSAPETSSRCRDKLREAVQRLHGRNHAAACPDPMAMAIVLDESYKGGCISHAAYGNVAYRICGQPATHTPIGDIRETDDGWSVAWREKT